MIRFLHAADLHLGLRVTRFEENACKRVGEARFTALQQLREKAAQLQVDFMVIAGDVFDDHTISRSDASRAFPILESSRDSCPVFMIPGNHDPLVPGGVWDRDRRCASNRICASIFCGKPNLSLFRTFR